MPKSRTRPTGASATKVIVRDIGRRLEETRADARILGSIVHEFAELLSVAHEWMSEHGCDCGTDEPGTCGLCRITAALGR